LRKITAKISLIASKNWLNFCFLKLNFEMKKKHFFFFKKCYNYILQMTGFGGKQQQKSEFHCCIMIYTTAVPRATLAIISLDI
jgi:hypothetical protein